MVIDIKRKCVIVILVLACLVTVCSGCGFTENRHNSYRSTGSNDQTRLSDSCGYLLCSGTSVSGDYYELVANQEETSQGFNITVGVIKNNTWQYPLSADFPFLGDDGLFHISVSLAGESGTSLAEANKVIGSIYFIDCGAFLMDGSRAVNSLLGYENFKVIFQCETKKSFEVNCEDTSLLYLKSEPTFYNGQVERYGHITTESGNLVMYTDVSDTASADLELRTYDWSLLNVNTLTETPIANGVVGCHPVSVLSEGLFFATDKCFYDMNCKKVIDLSSYDIDMWYNDDIWFESGECTFIAENELGTEFFVTIDKQGNVLAENRK